VAIVSILSSLKDQIIKKFGGESKEVFKLMDSLRDSPKKGKIIGNVGGVVIKELKYKNLRLYFITDGFKLKCMDEKELTDLLLRFVRMSDKKHQQKVIDEIRYILRNLGGEEFE